MTKPSLFIVFFISFVWTFQAQAQGALSLSQILEKAKSYNQDLKLMKKEEQSLKYEKRAAWGQALPKLSAGVSHVQNFKVPCFAPGVCSAGDYGMNYEAGITQPLYTFGAVGSAINAAEARFEVLAADVKRTENDLIYQVKASYYQYLLAKRNLQINQNLLKHARDNYNSLRANFRGGRAPQGDVLRLQADIESKRPAVANAETELKNAMINLNILMGQNPNRPLQIVGNLEQTFPKLSASKLSKTLEKEAPSLKSIESNADYADSLADVQWAAQMPQLGLFYNFNRQDQSYSDRFAKDRTMTTSTLGISLSWNIWDGGISHANYQKAKVDASKASLELTKAKDGLNQELYAAIAKFRTFKDNISSINKAVNLARKSYSLSQKRFRSGKTSITELNDTQSVLLQSEMQQIQNLFQLNMTYALIEKLIGKDIQ